jgi:hypothetical protein
MKPIHLTFLLVVLICTVTSFIAASPRDSFADNYATLPDGSKVDLSLNCPVCGMPVGGELGGAVTRAYRNGHLVGFAGLAAAVFRDGHVVGFEGARCLFIYNTIPKRFGIDVDQIVRRFVTDFDSGHLIDANNAYLVLGSEVRGPMGYDLIPFSAKEAADAFSKAYAGKRVVQLGTVVPKDVDRNREE